ncbi:MAG: RES family NAD+ phosphorylase [Acidimicrobiales bacterium]
MTFAPPPANPAELAEFPAREIPANYRYSRIHRQHHEPEWFCTCGDCRFDPPDRSAFGTCYLAGHPLGAFIERFGRLRAVPQSLIDLHRLAGLGLASPVRVADVTDRTVVGRWGLTAGLWAGGDYTASQLWAARFFEAGFSGIWYSAAHDTQGVHHSLALFGKPAYQPDQFLSYGDEPISDDLCDAAYEYFGMEVLPSAPI